MEFTGLIVQFLVLTFIVAGVIIFFLHRSLVYSTEGAVKRLNDEIAKAQRKQSELSEKLRQADEELTKRQAEARQLAEKMRSDAETASKDEREKLIAQARKEGEEIIAKAQGAKEKLKLELEKQMDVMAIKFGMQILNNILSQKGQGALNDVLIEEFLASLKNVDMSRIGSDIKSVELVTLNPIDENRKNQLVKLVKEKLNRDIALNNTTDLKIGGGAILKFGTMALDGSIQNLIREEALALQKQIETKER